MNRLNQALIVAGGMLASAVASAALPTAATDALTALEADATSMIAAIWPVAVIVTVGFIVLKLFKKGGNKAT